MSGSFHVFEQKQKIFLKIPFLLVDSLIWMKVVNLEQIQIFLLDFFFFHASNSLFCDFLNVTFTAGGL